MKIWFFRFFCRMSDLYLEENLKTKKRLAFHDGKFRIAVFSDLHGIADFDRRVFRDAAAIADAFRPDLVLINGDTVWRDAAYGPDGLRPFLTELDAVFSARGIPWAHVFGNHDHEHGFEKERQFSVYDEFEFCLSKRGPEGVEGTCNYFLPVFSSGGGRIAFGVWGLDSGGDIDDFLTRCGYPPDRGQITFPEPLYPHQHYDVIRFSQMAWYWQSSAELEKYNGALIPAMMFFHEALPEFRLTCRNPVRTGYRGTMREDIGCGPVNSGLFAEIVQRGDVKLVVCGHDHVNDFEGDILGIKLAMDAALGYDGYCDDDLRGGRIIDVNEADGSIKTYMIRSSECVKDYPGEPMRRSGYEQ